MAAPGPSDGRLSFPLMSQEENTFEINVCHNDSSYFEHQISGTTNNENAED